MAIEDHKEITSEDIKTLLNNVETSIATVDTNAKASDTSLSNLISALSTELTNFKNSYLNTIYPVGSIYVSVNNTNPATLFGGTWTQIKDTFLLSAGSSYTAGNTGGSATVTLTEGQLPSHTHSGGTTSEAGEHTHTRGTMNITGEFSYKGFGDDITNPYVTGAFGWYRGNDTEGANGDRGSIILTFDAANSWTGSTSSEGSHTHTVTLSNTGSGQSHNNMPPYLVVYMWKRTA